MDDLLQIGKTFPLNIEKSVIPSLYKALPKPYRIAISQNDFETLFRENFYFRELEDVLIIYILQSEWVGAHETNSYWYPKIVLPFTSPDSIIIKNLKSLVLKKKLFNICSDCNQLLPNILIGSVTCYSCLESNHGCIF